jgi:hypothetical protein
MGVIRDYMRARTRGISAQVFMESMFPERDRFGAILREPESALVEGLFGRGRSAPVIGGNILQESGDGARSGTTSTGTAGGDSPAKSAVAFAQRLRGDYMEVHRAARRGIPMAAAFSGDVLQEHEPSSTAVEFAARLQRPGDRDSLQESLDSGRREAERYAAAHPALAAVPTPSDPIVFRRSLISYARF